MVPNPDQKINGGWSNDPCTVISHKMIEKEMDYRGSKSVFKFNFNSVKEQRVDGSWNLNKSIFIFLRYTLTDFERNYQIKTHSNLIIQKRHYSDTLKDNNLMINNKNTLLNKPWFITGFTDAEGCFLIIVRKKLKNKLGWRLEPNFIINLHKKDMELLKLIKSYFEGIGRIGKERNACCDFTVGSINQIFIKIIPYFYKYPLKTKKLIDYLVPNEVVMMMKNGEHLTTESLQKIINIGASLNRGLTPILKKAFPNTIAFSKSYLYQTSNINSIKNKSILSMYPEWIAGFTSGDGCFKVNIRKLKTIKAGERVTIIFVLTQHIRDEFLLKSLKNFFGCGKAYSYKSHTEFICQSFQDNYNKILQFFRKYYIFGIKRLDFEDWGKIAEIMKIKAHLTNEGFNKISQISIGMNRGKKIKKINLYNNSKYNIFYYYIILYFLFWFLLLYSIIILSESLFF